MKSGGTNKGGSRQHGSDGNGSFTTSWGTNDNWAPEGRELLKPEEVIALSPRIAIAFSPGVPPIATTLPRYYDGSLYLTRRNWFKTMLASLIVLILAVVMALYMTTKAAEYGGKKRNPFNPSSNNEMWNM